MSDLQTVIKEAKAALEKGYVFIHVKDRWLQTLLTGLEDLQKENADKDDAIVYAMNQIQIKSAWIRKLETELVTMKNEEPACPTCAGEGWYPASEGDVGYGGPASYHECGCNQQKEESA